MSAKRSPIGLVLLLLTGSCLAAASPSVHPDLRGPHFIDTPVVLGAAANEPFMVDLNTLVQGGDGPLSWSALHLPSWLALDAAAGTLSGTPSNSDVGLALFSLSVVDGEAGVLNHPVELTVSPNVPPPPFWSQNPISLPDAVVNEAYSMDLSQFAFNPDGSPLTFRLLSGPAWISMSANGVITGVPFKADLGSASFVVQGSNPKGLQSDVVAQLNVVTTH